MTLRGVMMDFILISMVGEFRFGSLFFGAFTLWSNGLAPNRQLDELFSFFLCGHQSASTKTCKLPVPNHFRIDLCDSF